MPEPDLLSSLQPPTLQSVMAPLDTLGQVGVGLAGIGRAQNPFLVQAQDQFKQQIEMRRLQREVQQDRQKRNEALLSIYADLSKHENPEVRNKIVPEYAKVFETTFGTSLPPALIKELITKRMGDETLKSLYRDIVSRSYSDETLMERYHVAPQEFTEHKKAAQTNSARKFAGLDPVEADEVAALTLSGKRADTFFKTHPGLIANSDQVVYAEQYARKKFGRPLFDLSDPQLNEAAQAGLAQVKQEEIDKEQRAIQKALTIETAKEEAREKARIVAEERKQAAKAKDPKLIASVRSGLILGEQVKAIAEELGNRGFLSKQESVLTQAIPFAKRHFKSGNPFVAAFNVHSGTMVSLGRAVGDIGPRAMQAYASLVEVVKSATSVQAVQAAVENLLVAIRDSHPTMDPEMLKVPSGRDALMQIPTFKKIFESEASPVPKGFIPVKP